MQEKLLFLVGQVTRLLSSIIKNYRTLQGESISIGIEKIFHLKEANSQEEESLKAQDDYKKQVQDNYKKIEEEARNKAQKMLSEAEIQAKAILEEAYLQKENLLNRCHEEIQTLKQESADKILLDQQASSEEVKHIFEQAYREKQTILEQAEPELVEVLQVLLHTIIDTKIVSGVEWLTLLVKRIIEKERINENIKVHVAPKLYEEYAKDFEADFEDLSVAIQLEPDVQLTETSCLVETQVGSIHYDVSKGLQKVLDEIKILSAINGG